MSEPLEEKKSETKPAMESRYDPKFEERIYAAWLESGCFDPDVCIEKGITHPNAEPFSIVLPPPNVTGTLHMGHAAMLAIEDIIVRYERMRGKRTLWVPGTDHAAIATQSKVEKQISKTEGKSRYDLGREEFLRRVRAFAQASHDTIVTQLKKMGSSLDWGREAYTLDEKRSLAVRTAFKTLYDLGLIYRGYRVVNWDPKGQTTISDDEIVYEERTAKFYTFKYSKDFPISISTTRPETKVGDTAVAVHPDDPRYKDFVGKEYDIIFCGVPLHIKIIADAAVDKDFGTGALGVTPAHSMIDWEMAQRHGLPMKQVIDERGRMTVEGELQGKKTTEAREILVERLRADGLLEKEEDVKQNISLAERTGGIIEPLPKLQWFVNVNKEFRLDKSNLKGIKDGELVTLKNLMIGVVADEQIEIIPHRFEPVYFNWVKDLRDWCISRQIWFGHRIPVWYCMKCGEPHVDLEVNSKLFLARHGETDWNKEDRYMSQENDIPLNDTGLAQAQAAAEQLKNEKIDLIVSSPSLRTRQTAEIISKENGAPVAYEKDLEERYTGEWGGLTIQEVKAKYPEEFEHRFDYDFRHPGGESWQELETRVWALVEKYKKEYAGKNIVFVTHGGPIRILQAKLRNLKPEDLETTDNASVFELELGAPCAKCSGEFYEQDPDTLDTWFSSGLWTFSTLGWPERTKDLETYHPTALLETGYDILFFWVARMILMTTSLLGQVPFRKVYLHGLVRDEKGKKMSKSLGNVIDPVDMIQKYGADATRLSLIIGAAPGNDIKLSEDRVRGYRNFTTKIWNAARFVLMNRPEFEKGEEPHMYRLTDEQQKDLEAFSGLKKEITAHIDAYEFHLAGEKLYHYFWHTFADVLIEREKNALRGDDREAKIRSYMFLKQILEGSLKLLHPFMPFISEEIWQIIHPGKMLMVEKW